MSCFPFSAFPKQLKYFNIIFIKLTNSGSLSGVHLETLGGCNGAPFPWDDDFSTTAQVTWREPATEPGLQIPAQINNILLLCCQPEL